jgi:predicted MFS family arabinose efflux permease
VLTHRLLARTGATARQVAGMFGWHALFVTVAVLATATIMVSLRAMPRRRG